MTPESSVRSPGLYMGMTPEELIHNPQTPEEIGTNRMSHASSLVLGSYATRIHQPRANDHPRRVAAILADFTHYELSDLVYDAVALHDIAQSATNIEDMRCANARRALKSYSGKIISEDSLRHGPGGDTSSWEYVATLLSDLDSVEHVAEQYRQKDTDNALLNTVLASKVDTTIPEMFWSVEPDLVDPKDMLKLLKNVNLEAVLIKSAELLDNLKNPPPKDKSILQDVFEAESFYAPILEVMGYEGFAMAIRSNAAILRLQKMGEMDLVELAREQLAVVSDRERVKDFVSQLLSRVLPGESIEEHAVNNTSEHEIIVGSSILALPELKDLLRNVYWRVKSRGSLAFKCSKTDENRVADILGVTLEVQNYTEQEVVLSSLIRCIKQNGNVKENPAPSRTEAYSVQGSTDFIKRMTQAVTSIGLKEGEVDYKRKENGYEVVKATFTFNIGTEETPEWLPVEFMVQTAEARKQGQIGEPSHIAHKGKLNTCDVESLQKIKNRRQKIHSVLLNERSLARGVAFRAMVASTRHYEY